MAKRPTRSEADEAGQSTTQSAKRPRARATRELGPDTVAGREPDSAKPAIAAREESPSTEREPTEDEIRLRAYMMYLERGGGHGSDFEDWVRAEAELRRGR